MSSVSKTSTLGCSNIANGLINEFISTVSTKFNIDNQALIDLWNESNSESSVITPKSESVEDLQKMKKNDLILLCKSKGVKCTGNKEELISYINGTAVAKTTAKKPKAEKSEKKSSSKVDVVKPIIKKLISNIPVISVHKNQFGNHEHAETSLVFNKNQKVIGKQNPAGNIDDLSSEDINICNKFKFAYVLPTNLDKKTSLENVVVEEIDDDEDKSSKPVRDDDTEVEEEAEVLEDEEEYEEEYEEELYEEED